MFNICTALRGRLVSPTRAHASKRVLWSKREAVTHYASRLNPMAYRVHLRTSLFQSYGENENIIPLIVTRVTLSLDCRSSTPGRNFSTHGATVFAKLSCRRRKEEEEKERDWNAFDKQERNVIG